MSAANAYSRKSRKRKAESGNRRISPLSAFHSSLSLQSPIPNLQSLLHVPPPGQDTGRLHRHRHQPGADHDDGRQPRLLPPGGVLSGPVQRAVAGDHGPVRHGHRAHWTHIDRDGYRACRTLRDPFGPGDGPRPGAPGRSRLVHQRRSARPRLVECAQADLGLHPDRRIRRRLRRRTAAIDRPRQAPRQTQRRSAAGFRTRRTRRTDEPDDRQDSSAQETSSGDSEQHPNKIDKPDKRKPHSPGVWIVYFSLAALPLFGLERYSSAITPIGSDMRSRCFCCTWPADSDCC